jgi:hypothetical protein
MQKAKRIQQRSSGSNWSVESMKWKKGGIDKVIPFLNVSFCK